MSATTAQGTLWVCQDCYLTHHGYDEHELGYKPELEPLSLIGDVEITAGLLCEEHEGRPEECSPEECETREFSWSTCQGCGSTLGGTRHALTYWA